MHKPDLAPSLLNAAPSLLVVLYALVAIPPLSEHGLPLSVLVASAPLGAVLIALSVVDLRSFRLPDALTLPLILAGPLLAFAMGWDGLLWRLGSAAAGFLVLFGLARTYQAVRGRAGLGLGDAKLFAAAGAWLGVEGLSTVLLWACAGALLAILAAIPFRYPVTASSRIAFGPFLAFGFWMVWLYGPIG